MLLGNLSFDACLRPSRPEAALVLPSASLPPLTIRNLSFGLDKAALTVDTHRIQQWMLSTEKALELRPKFLSPWSCHDNQRFIHASQASHCSPILQVARVHAHIESNRHMWNVAFFQISRTGVKWPTASFLSLDLDIAATSSSRKSHAEATSHSVINEYHA